LKKKYLNAIKNYDLKFLLIERYLLLIGHISTLINNFFYRGQFSIDRPYKIWGVIRIYIHGRGIIKIGKNFHAVSNRRRSFLTLFSPCHLTTVGSGEISIGDNVGLNGVTILARKKVEIGDFTMIAPNVILVDHDGHVTWPAFDRWHVRDEPKGIKIGQNVWIGINSLILKGVHIGDNSIIAAGSVVSKSIPKNCMAAGGPARVIKTLGSKKN
jgi:acetyltransferase-like isoleucine patch superfamily enzyme